VLSSQILERATRRVLETTASVARSIARPGNGLPPDFAGLVAALSLGGPRAGTLFVLCDAPLATRLAAQMLGLAPGDLERQPSRVPA
jgi:hypothetical protein